MASTLALLASAWAPSAVADQPTDHSAVEINELPPLPLLELLPEDPAAVPAPAEAGDEVVTGAARREQSLGNVASAVTVISRDRIQRFGYRTVAEAIAGAAGVHLVDDRLSTRVGIRGLQPIGDFNTRILVIIDGTSMTEAWSHLSGVGYDLPVSIDEIERIEVIRGPVSSIYGTNAFFGIVNIITRGALADVRTWGRVTAAQIGGGTASAGVAAGTPDRQVRAAAAVSWRRGEQLQYALSDVDGEPLSVALGRDKDRGLSAMGSVSAALGAAFMQVRAYSAERVIPFGPYGGDLEHPYRQINRQVVADASRTLQGRRYQASARIFAGAYRFADQLTEVAEDGALSRLDVTGDARTVGVEVRGRYQAIEGGLLDVTAGLELSYNDTFHRAESVPVELEISDASDGDELKFGLQGLYAELESTPRPWLGVTAGVRLDRHSEFSSDGRLSPRVALFLSSGELAGVKLLYAEGFRNPSTYESHYQDDDIAANFMLRPERIRSFELVGWARPNPALSARVSLYRWSAFEVMKQVLVDDEGTMKVQYQNLAELNSNGLEVEARVRDPRGWYGFFGANLSEVTDEAGERVIGAPTLTTSLGASTPVLWRGVTLSSELQYISSRTTANEQRDARRHVTWNAAAVVPAWHSFDLTVGVRNLLGQREDVPAAEDYVDLQGSAVGIVPGEGRELYVRLGATLR